MIYLELFWAFFQVGLFSFGGGMAAMPLIQEQVVTKYGWLTMGEFTDLITIAEMTPGPIAINSATFVGIQVGGIPGAVIATLGCIFAPVLIVLLFAVLYQKYRSMNAVQGVLRSLRPAVVGLIAAAGVSIVSHALVGAGKITLSLWGADAVALAMIAVGVFVLRKFKVNAILVMLVAGAVGGIVYSLIP